MMILNWLFDTQFAPRGTCWGWYPLLAWLFICTDILIFVSYMAIPAILGYFIRKRKDLPFSFAFWLFIIFILGCGFTHGLNALAFFVPIFNFNAIVHILTAIASLGTALYLIKLMPEALALKTPSDLEKINMALETQRARHYAVTNNMREAIIIADYD